MLTRDHISTQGTWASEHIISPQGTQLSRHVLVIARKVYKTVAHLVSRFACNTRVIVDASSNPPVSNVKSL